MQAALQEAMARFGDYRPNLDALHMARGHLESEAKALSKELRRRPGPTGRSDLFYARIASLYVVVASNSNRPIEDLARYLERPIAHARQLVTTARARGMLSNAPGRGRSGGVMTKQASKLLSAHDADQSRH
jgi:hypothetical protein